MKLFAALLLCIGMSQTAVASYQCGEPSWQADENLKGKMFKGILSINCQLTSNSEPQFQKLKDFYVKKYTQGDSVLEVKQDPESTSYEGLPGVEFVSKINSSTEHGKMTIDMEYLIAGASGEGFVLKHQSKKIKAKGNAKHTKFTSGNLKISRSEDGKLNLVFAKNNHVKKPFIAPTGLFIRKVKEGVLEEFNQEYPQVLNEVIDNI